MEGVEGPQGCRPVRMPLEDYHRKRQFQQTPEPSGAPQTPGAGSSFVIQKHSARRRHYDFRLEMDGVLKSWAVPKGPSRNPLDKRLAVLVEDHPLDYAHFEGVIPDGNYGAGPVMVWDNGTYSVEGKLSAAEQVAKGELKFSLQGQRLRGGYVLVKLKQSPKNEWLLIKHRDEEVDPDWDIERQGVSVLTGRTLQEIESGAPIHPAFAGELEGARQAPLPSRMEPMLATLASQPFSHPDWLFELKWDGMRALARIDEGRLEIWSRRRRAVEDQFPELAVLPERLSARQAILDGEIVVLDPDGRPNFERMQTRMHGARPSPALVDSNPVIYYLFDILYCDGYDLRAAPLIERKQFLRRILDSQPPLRYCDHVREQGRELFELAAAKSLEGIVAKRAGSSYQHARSPDWVKIKASRELDAVIGGCTAGQPGRRFGALLLGLYDGDQLRYIGSVGTGYTHQTQEELWAEMDRRRAARCPFVPEPATKAPAWWVQPELVARVKYAEWTAERRLRTPVYLGLRDDGEASDCRVEPEEAGPPPPSPPRPISTSQILRSWAALEAELTGGHAANVVVELEGKNFRLSNLNKVYFPKEGYTKRDVLAYYYRVAPVILPFLRRRPLVLRRTPDGVGGGAFFQKDAGDDAPPWFETLPIPSERNKLSRYFIANDTVDLLFLTNLGCVEHNAWSSQVDDIEHPDYLFFDLDPSEGTAYSVVVEVAGNIYELLGKMGLKAFLKTSGATGFHLYLPLERVYSSEQVRAFTEIVARVIAARLPEHTTLERTVGKRSAGEVYLDYSQNGHSRPLTIVYSARPFPGASVSAPVSPGELRPDLAPGLFTIKTLPDRLDRVGDLWADFWKSRQRLETALERLRPELASGSHP